MNTKPVLIFGARGLGKAALEILKSHEILVYGFLDDDPSLHGKEIDSHQIFSSTDDQAYLKLIGQKCDAFVASDENKYRKKLVQMLKTKRKVMPLNVVHAQAIISSSAEIGYGNFINAGAQLGAASKIGQHCILNAQALVDYEVEMGDYVQIGAGARINAGVEIGDEAFIGTGASIIPGVKVGAKARIGAGSVVIKDVPSNTTVFGNPAQEVS